MGSAENFCKGLQEKIDTTLEKKEEEEESGMQSMRFSFPFQFSRVSSAPKTAVEHHYDLQ